MGKGESLVMVEVPMDAEWFGPNRVRHETQLLGDALSRLPIS